MLKIVTSWKTLFAYAHAEGQARLAFKEQPSEENKKRLDETIARHEDYRQVCLKADEMVDFPNISSRVK